MHCCSQATADSCSTAYSRTSLLPVCGSVGHMTCASVGRLFGYMTCASVGRSVIHMTCASFGHMTCGLVGHMTSASFSQSHDPCIGRLHDLCRQLVTWTVYLSVGSHMTSALVSGSLDLCIARSHDHCICRPVSHMTCASVGHMISASVRQSHCSDLSAVPQVHDRYFSVISLMILKENCHFVKKCVRFFFIGSDSRNGLSL